MNKFNNFSTVALIFLVAACAPVTRDSWDWLSDPDAQKWREVGFHAVGREISFSVPDRLISGGKRTEYWPDEGGPTDRSNNKLSIEGVDETVPIIASFTWDTWWGGFYKKGGEDFYLTVKIFRTTSVENLLDLDLDGRISWVHEFRLSNFSKPESGKNPNREYFEENFWVESFEADSGQWWVRHNDPMVSEDHQRFITPVSAGHILDFTFFVNRLRYDFEEDPQWNQSRWELVEKIMKTVRITPDPFAGGPGEIPAQ